MSVNSRRRILYYLLASLIIGFLSPVNTSLAITPGSDAYIDNIEIYKGSGAGLTDTLTLSAAFDSTTATLSTDASTQEVNSETVTLVVTPGVGTETVTVNSIDTFTVSSQDTISAVVNLIAGTDNLISIASMGTGLNDSIYILTIHRAVDKSLSDLTMTDGTVGYARGTYAYSVSVGNSISSTVFTPTAYAPDSVTAITINGGDSTTAVTLNVGSNTVYVVVEGVSDSGQTPNITYETYTVTVNRASAPAPAPSPVYVPATPQAALVLSSSATTVEWGTQAKLSVTGGSGTGKVTYSSSGSTFCAVDKDGNVTPVSAGTCTVTANKEGDGTYSSATSNSVTITAVDMPVTTNANGSSNNSDATVSVGTPVSGVTTVKFKVADSYAGEKVSVILATKSSSGKTLYKTLGSAKVSSTGAVTFKTKVKLPVGAVIQLKSAGTVILSKSIK